jgi:hypothetical protein
MSKIDEKKCQPLKCHHFKHIYEAIWDKQPVDVFVERCGYRTKQNCCLRESESLDKVLIT